MANNDPSHRDPFELKMLPVRDTEVFLQEPPALKLSSSRVDQHSSISDASNPTISIESLRQRRNSFGIDHLISSLQEIAQEKKDHIILDAEKPAFADMRSRSRNMQPRLHRNEVIGGNDRLLEPVPLKGDYANDDGSISQRKRRICESSRLTGLTTYTTCLQDPFAPRPIVQTKGDGIEFVDETTIGRLNLSTSTIDTDFEDEAECYFDVADMLSDDESLPPTKKLRSSMSCPLDDFQSSIGTAVDVTSPPTPPPSPELQSENHRISGSSNRHQSFYKPHHVAQQPCETSTPRPMDASSVMARLDQLMFKSEVTQAALQYFDKARGLPKSHCQTMVNSSRSRKQLLEGKIIKKWNGRPLLRGPDDISVTFEGAGRHGWRRKRTTPKATPKETEIPPEETGQSGARDKPTRRMSAPPSYSSNCSDE